MIFDSLDDEDRFNAKLRMLASLSAKEKRQYGRQLDDNEKDRFARHCETNSAILENEKIARELADLAEEEAEARAYDREDVDRGETEA